MTQSDALRAKLSKPSDRDAAPILTPELVWKRATRFGLARGLALSVEVDGVTADVVLPETAACDVEMPAMILLLDSSVGAGVAILSMPLVTGLIEHQTLGFVTDRAIAKERITAIDAALLADPVDRILETQEALAAEVPARDVAGGFRYARALEHPREIALRLRDAPHRRSAVSLSLGPDGARSGTLTYLMPIPMPSVDMPSDPPRVRFQRRLRDRVMGAAVTVDAVLHRATLDIRAVQAMKPGDCLKLPQRALSQIQLVTHGDSVIGTGRLGQRAGLKAVRIGDAIGTDFTLAAAPSATEAGLASGAMEDMVRKAEAGPRGDAAAEDAKPAPKGRPEKPAPDVTAGVGPEPADGFASRREADADPDRQDTAKSASAET